MWISLLVYPRALIDIGVYFCVWFWDSGFGSRAMHIMWHEYVWVGGGGAFCGHYFFFFFFSCVLFILRHRLRLFLKLHFDAELRALA